MRAQTRSSARRAGLVAISLARLITELAVVTVLAMWGALTWPAPWSVGVAIAAPAAAVLLWALFVSPRAIIRLHPFIRAVVEIAIFLAGMIALWDLGAPVAGMVFAAVAMIVGAAYHTVLGSAAPPGTGARGRAGYSPDTFAPEPPENVGTAHTSLRAHQSAGS